MVLSVCFACQPTKKTSLEVEPLLALAKEKAMNMALSLEDTTRFPRSIKEDGSIKVSKPSGWTAGFFPGTLAYLYGDSPDPALKAQVYRWTAGLEPNLSLNWRTHDLGFMLFYSYGRAFEATGDSLFWHKTLTGADSLSKMFNPAVGTTESWPWRKNWSHPTIIDNMLNLELLFWAAKHGGNPEYAEMARTHAETTRKNHIREDFSSWHVIDYDEATGEVRGKYTDQGHADNSTWSRGQAWGIYGFTMAYRETGEKAFLETATQMADYYLSRLPEDGVPYWDFDAPEIPNEPKDASAACVVVSALVELSQLVEKEALGKKYLAKAEFMLESLATNYLYAPEESPFLLKHSTGSKPHKSEIDVPLIYADYFFVEALLRYKAL